MTRRREIMVQKAKDRRTSKREVKVTEARNAVLDSLEEETDKLSWAAERDLLRALHEDIELRLSDNDYRKPDPRRSRSGD